MRRPVLVIALAVLSSGGAAACAAVLGIPDVTLAEEGIEGGSADTGTDRDETGVDSAPPDGAVPDPLLAAVEIVAVDDATCARSRADAVYCFGQLQSDVLPTPKRIADFSGIAVALGQTHACVLRANGQVACLGGNFDGQLGTGSAGADAGSKVPVVVSVLDDARRIASGGLHTCAIRRAGPDGVACWGYGREGQLGNGRTGDPGGAVAPETIAGFSGAWQIAASRYRTCAIKSATGAGPVFCWGTDIGNAAQLVSSTPVDVTGLSDAISIATSLSVTYAVRATGSVVAWGPGVPAQVAGGTDAPARTPVLVPGIADAKSVVAGTDHACAIRSSGSVVCWGSNEYGQLGVALADAAGPRAPVTVEGLDGLGEVTSLAAGKQHTCALVKDSGIYCWGSNRVGQLGRGAIGAQPQPRPARVARGE